MFRSRDQVELMQLSFPGCSAEQVAGVVRTLGGVGRVGTDAKGRGAFFTVGEVSGRHDVETARARWQLVRVGRDGYAFDLAVPELADHLGLAASDVAFQRFEVEADDTLAEGWRAVLVLPAHEREYRPVGKEVAGSHMEVREAHGWHLVTWSPAPGTPRPSEDLVLEELIVRTRLGGPDRGILLLADAGHTTVLDVAAGDVEGDRHWPADLWPMVHADDLDDIEPARELVADIVAGLIPQHADELFTTWGPDPVRRRAAFRGHPVDLPEVVAALGLPPETLEVLAGTSDLPVERHEATDLRGAMREARGTMLDETAASRFFSVELLSNLSGIVIAVVVLLLGRDTVPTWMWWAGIGIGVVSAVAFATQVAAWRRRSQVEGRPARASDR
ncbi:MAG TPA: hypothetical protein VGE77_11865 [Nocardioides sp.]